MKSKIAEFIQTTPGLELPCLVLVQGILKSRLVAGCCGLGQCVVSPDLQKPPGAVNLCFRNAGDGPSGGAASGVLPAGHGHEFDGRSAHDAGRCARHAGQGEPDLAQAHCPAHLSWRASAAQRPARASSMIITGCFQ